MVKIRAILYNWTTADRLEAGFLFIGLNDLRIRPANTTLLIITDSQIYGFNLSQLGLFWKVLVWKLAKSNQILLALTIGDLTNKKPEVLKNTTCGEVTKVMKQELLCLMSNENIDQKMYFAMDPTVCCGSQPRVCLRWYREVCAELEKCMNELLMNVFLSGDNRLSRVGERIFNSILIFEEACTFLHIHVIMADAFAIPHEDPAPAFLCLYIYGE